MAGRKIEAVGFDWDGTLIDSMGAKAQSFAEATIQYHSELIRKKDSIMKLYLSTRGTPRVIQLEKVEEKYNLRKLPESQVKEWSDLFTALYINQKLPLFPDSISTIDGLKERGYKVFLSSSVPQHDLDNTLKSYPLKGCFEFILGTRDGTQFIKGTPHLQYVSKSLNIPIQNLAMIDDGPDGLIRIKQSGAYTIGKADPRIKGAKEEIQKTNPDLIIEQLEELLQHFK